MTKSETIKEINKELQSLHLRVAACDRELKELLAKGLHLTERYKMNEDAKYKYLTIEIHFKNCFLLILKVQLGLLLTQIE